MEALYPRVPRESLPKEHVCHFPLLGLDGLFISSQWFPDAYYGQGQRGHMYHVFDEVRPIIPLKNCGIIRNIHATVAFVLQDPLM